MKRDDGVLNFSGKEGTENWVKTHGKEMAFAPTKPIGPVLLLFSTWGTKYKVGEQKVIKV